MSALIHTTLPAPTQQFLALTDDLWVDIKDGNPSGVALFRRHYSFKARKRGPQKQPHFCGPGQKTVLLTPCGRALFVWRKFRSMNDQPGVNCAVFRNEGAGRSSDLIRAAMEIAWRRWPGERLYTYVNPRKVKSANPGYCFLCAGWRKCGITKARHLLIFDVLPRERDS